MPDQFKNFLQKHRNDVDDRNVPFDLFDQIMEKSFSDQKTTNISTTRFKSISYYAIRIAAASILLVGLYFVIQLSNENNQVNPIANSSTIQNKENQVDNSTKNEVVNSNHSNEIEINKESETISPIASQNKIVNTKSVKHKSVNKEVLVQKQVPTPAQNFIAVQNSNNLTDEAKTKSNEEVVETLANNINKEEISSESKLEETKHESKEIASLHSSNSVSNTDQLKSTVQGERGIISLDEKVKKGIFSFLSKKSRQWSNNTIAIDTKTENRNTKLDIHVKTEQIAFAKSLKITSF